MDTILSAMFLLISIYVSGFAIKANLFMQLCTLDLKTFLGVDFWSRLAK